MSLETRWWFFLHYSFCSSYSICWVVPRMNICRQRLRGSQQWRACPSHLPVWLFSPLEMVRQTYLLASHRPYLRCDRPLLILLVTTTVRQVPSLARRSSLLVLCWLSSLVQPSPTRQWKSHRCSSWGTRFRCFSHCRTCSSIYFLSVLLTYGQV